MIRFAENLNKMIAAGLGGALEAPRTEVAVGHHVRYMEASGAVAGFETNIAAPIRSLRVDMEPIQEGTGDPSPDNIRPITGRDAVTVYRSGSDMSDPQIVTVQLGQTVYGGTLDVVSGELVVDMAMVTYDGSENWYTNVISGGVKHRMALDSLPSGIKTVANNAEIPDIVTNLLPAISAESSWIGTNGISMQQTYGWRIYCEAFNTSDVAPWKAFLAEHPLTIAYKLATPQTIQLTPEQLTTLIGDNNVWSDDGNISLEYPYYEETEGY